MTGPARVVVTGANGFIGGHLVRHLRASGHEVVGIVRSREGGEGQDVRLVARDLVTASTVQDLLRPGDVVVHLAARAHIMHDRIADPLAAYRAANVAPMRMLCESAVAAGVSRIVFLSSAKVYGEARRTPYTLQDTPRPVDPYGRSKWEAEEVLREADPAGSLAWTILRPPFVYGSGGKGNFPRLVQLARVASRIPLPLGGIHNARSVIFVGNLVDAIRRCAVHPAARDRVFLPTDRRDVSTPELIEIIARAQGRRARLFPCPIGLLRTGATLTGRRRELERLTESLQLDGSALRDELAWTPPHSLEESIRLSLAPASAANGN
jgi:nucleoside-diphosphate-sugar epimerase